VRFSGGLDAEHASAKYDAASAKSTPPGLSRSEGAPRARMHRRVPMIRMMVLPGAAGSGARSSGCLRRLDRLCRRCRSRPARAGRYCSVAAGVLEGAARAIVWMTMTVLDVLWSPVRGSGRP